ncbi:MAG: hypothetical protein LIP16_22215 [Clostridium sp.]|nr:hypothetical protein [Clostridium sp.]
MAKIKGEVNTNVEAGKFGSEERKQWGEQRAKEKAEIDETIKSIINNYRENPENLLELLEFGSRFYKYSARNNMLLHKQNPYVTYVQNYTDWKNAGWPVKKGETGLWIYHPQEYNVLLIGEKIIPWSNASDEQKQAFKNGEIKGEKRIGFKLAKTFDISQTLCPPEAYPRFFHVGYASTEHATIAEGLEAYSKDSLKTIVTKEDVKSIALKGMAQLKPKEDGYWHIRISDKLNDTEMVSTLTHEIGHQLMHRNSSEKPASLLEVESDCFSIMLQHHIGLDVSALTNRQRHLVRSFHQWQNDQNELIAANPNAKVTSVDTVINDVFKVYRQEIDKIDKAIDAARAQEAVKDMAHADAAEKMQESPMTTEKALPSARCAKYEYCVSIVPKEQMETVLMEEHSATAAGALKHYQELNSLPCMSNPNIKLEVVIKQKEYSADGADFKEYSMSKKALEAAAYEQAKEEIISHLKETGEPMVLFRTSESSKIDDYTYMNLRDANNKIYHLNKGALNSQEIPARMEYQIYYKQDGQLKGYQGVYVSGEQVGKTITSSIEERANIRLEDKRTAIEDRPRYEKIKNEFVPFLEHHEQLSALETMAGYTLQDTESSAAVKEHAAQLLDFITEQREALNTGRQELDVENMPQLKGEHKDYRMGPSRSSTAIEFRNHGYTNPTKEQIDSMVKLNKLSIKQTGKPLSLEKVFSIYAGNELAPSKELNAAVREVGEACKEYEALHKEMLHQSIKILPPAIG